jgi:hypothetical protein
VEAVRTRQATIDDLIERLLDKGVILNLDLVIGVAGIPLIGVNLRAAIASIETMIEYGFMQAWDEQLRQYASAELQRKKLALSAGETVLLEMYGSHWYSNGIYRAWRPGRLFLTDRRLIVYRQEPAEVLFQTPLAAIADLAVKRETYFTGAARDLLYLALEGGEIAAVYAEDLDTLHALLLAALDGLGLHPAGSAASFVREQKAAQAIGERVLAEGKLWWQAPAAGIQASTWRPGWLYLTVERLLWWSEFDQQMLVDIPLRRVAGLRLESVQLGGGAAAGSGFGPREVLVVTLGQAGGGGSETGEEAVLFAGDALPQWRRQIKEQVLDYQPYGDEGGFDA